MRLLPCVPITPRSAKYFRAALLNSRREIAALDSNPELFRCTPVFPFTAIVTSRAGEMVMMRKLFVVAAALAVIVLASLWFLTIPKTIAEAALPPRKADLANGKTMFHIGGCSSCHAVPKQDDQAKLGGGLALRSPFGTFYVPNISPDPGDGIGKWTEAQFVTAM